MRRAVLAIAALGLVAASPQPDRLARLLAEIRKSDHARFGCFEKDGLIRGSDSADKVVLEYQRSRGLANATSARDLLADLIDSALRPTDSTIRTLRQSLLAAGPTAASAEDVCRCLYFSGQHPSAEDMVSIAPVATGEFWAGRILQEDGHGGEALAHYRRSLQDAPSDPRTRLYLGIALSDEQQFAAALEALSGIDPGWAPGPVAYWRASALLRVGKPAEARRLLEPIQGGWPIVPTIPEASIGSAPVQATTSPVCLLVRARTDDGDERGADALLSSHETCRAELARRDLRQGRPFQALLDIEAQFGEEDKEPLVLTALSRLGECRWARDTLEQWQGWCEGKHPPRNCSALGKSAQEVAGACSRNEVVADRAAATLRVRLRAPRLSPFEERPVPAAERWTGQRTEETQSTKDYPPLSNFAIMALSPRAKRMFAVSVSQDVDPRGEVSAGGYWLHLSADGGKTWEGPYYLGFAQQFPYVVQSATRIAAFDGNHVNLEVERRKVDESTITFPPVGLRARKVVKDIYLSIDIAAVRRDSDGDGLTDLLEEKLGLDPKSPDTDGDGIPDGSDPLPLQARSDAESSDQAQLMAAALPFLFGNDLPIQQTAATGDQGSIMYRQGRPFATARTLFIAGDVVLPHEAGVRAIVFSQSLLADYQRKFGATYPMDLPLVAFDTDRQRALIRYNFHWRGGSLLAERKNGRWTITQRDSWIT